MLAYIYINEMLMGIVSYEKNTKVKKRKKEISFYLEICFVQLKQIKE